MDRTTHLYGITLQEHDDGFFLCCDACMGDGWFAGKGPSRQEIEDFAADHINCE